jgi:hypothetical protein
MDIRIETHDERRQLVLTNISVSDADTFKCNAIVKSGWLECNRQFFFSRYYAEKFLMAIIDMNSKFSGTAELKAEYEDQVIVFTCNKMGRVVITGEFIEHSMLSQIVEFGFETDQTILPGLIKQFESLLKKFS